MCYSDSELDGIKYFQYAVSSVSLIFCTLSIVLNIIAKSLRSYRFNQILVLQISNFFSLYLNFLSATTIQYFVTSSLL